MTKNTPEYNRAYYLKHRERIIAKNIISSKEWKKKNPEKANASARKSIKKLRVRRRREVLELMGSKCVRCGFNDFRALQIDHIDGGGLKKIKAIGGTGRQLKIILENGKYKGLQLLCANCNWIKRDENNETTGPPRRTYP